MGSCRIITSPLTGERVTSKTWEDIRSQVKSDAEADQMYDRLLSPQFIAWFGPWTDKSQNSSKVVNEHGEPQVVYHGTEVSGIEKFKRSKIGDYLEGGERGFFFTPNRVDLSFYGQSTYAAFLNIRNPIISTDQSDSVKVDREKNDGFMITYPTGEINFTEIIAYEPNQIKSIANDGRFSSESDNIYHQQSNQGLQINEQLDKKMDEFLSSIGVNVSIVDTLKGKDGKVLSAVAKADMMAKTIEILNGRADISTLPEEAAHFFVELLGEENPLYQSMFKDITSYKIYEDTLNEYRTVYKRADGTPNFTKIKKEAIGKLISTYIVAQHTGEEFPEKIAKAEKWWERVWRYLTNIFKQNPSNPFMESANRISQGEIRGLKKIDALTQDVYFQLSNVYDNIKKDQQRIHLDNSLDARGEKKHIYTVDGKAVVDKYGNPRSVTSVEVDTWYKDRFPTDSRSDRQKNVDKLKAEEGDKIHADAQDIIERYIDKDTGELKALPAAVTKYNTNKSIYDKLETYIGQVLRSYPPNTKFLTENRIYDRKKNLAGSIDLLILLPDGSADIYDWKSQEVGKGATELKWFKQPAYRIQLDAYKRILTQEYGITKFNKVRAIPISTKLTYQVVDNTYTPREVSNIEIGDYNVKNIPEEKSYLLPVVAVDETTGDKNLDKLIAQLNAIHEKISVQRVPGKDKSIKAEELNKIQKAIRDLQVRGDMESFVENGLAEVNKYQDKIDNNTVTKGDVLGSLDILQVYADSQLLLKARLVELKKAISTKQDQKVKESLEELQSNFLKMSGNARDVLYSMQEKLKEIGTEIAAKEGISDLLTSEKSMDMLKRTFRSISTLPTRAIRTFYKMLSVGQSKRDFAIEDTNKQLRELKSNLETWATAKGLSGVNMFDGILKLDKDGNWTGDFLNKFSQDYFIKKNEAIKAGDYKWIMDNNTFDRVKYEVDLEAYKKVLETVVYSPDEQRNQERRDKALQLWIDARDVDKSDFAKINKKNYYLKPIDKWFSDKWVSLHKDENTPLRKAYEYFQSLKQQSDQLGMIDYETGFIPSMRQDKLELAVFSSLTNIFNTKGLFESLRTDSDKSYGEIDPISGELVKEIPVYFTHDLGQTIDGKADYSMKSKDLFKVFSIWGNHMHNYEAMKNIQEAADVIAAVERTKKSLVTNTFGKVTKERKEKVGNDINADVLEHFINYYVYGQKISDNNDYAVKLFGNEYSATKLGKAVVNWMTMKTLSLNVLSGTATFVGGTGNAFFQATKRQIFTERDWAHGFKDFTSRDKITVSLLHALDLSLEDEKSKHSNDLSVSAAVKYFTMDKLMVIQKYGDLAVQLPIGATMLRTHMVHEGKIVDINTFVKDKYNYTNTFYSLPQEEQDALRTKIDEEVRQLKDTQSIKAIAKINGDTIEIPGINLKGDEFISFRNKIKKVNKSIIGNATHDDLNQIRMSILGQVLMQFRSWMPQMITERFGDMSYDTDMDNYQYGKARLFFKHLVSSKFLPLVKELITGFGSNTISRAKERYIEFKARMLDQGEDFNMSEADFIDMYLGNLRSQLREMIVFSAFLGLLFKLKPDDDDDKTGVRKYVYRMMDKYQNEFSFYYSPSEFTQLLKSPVPVVGLLTDFEKLITNSFGQLWGFSIGDEDIQNKNHPMKYLLKSFPITKEAVTTAAIFDDDFRTSWGR